MTADEVFRRFPTLHTPRLTLREPRASDAPALYAWRSDPEVTRPYAAEPYARLGQAEDWIRNRIADFGRRDGIAWILADRVHDTALGMVCYWHFDADFRCAEVGYELARSSWGRGLATEGAGEVLRFGFEELGLHRVEACPLARNRPSVHVLEKLGFVLEGRLRQRVAAGPTFEDQLYLATLEPEWTARVRGAASR